ncbi:MAG TPA: hypothetical protein VJN96_23015 [Vicinamibacterales bacterium]|nr:hypothetical protein [Vicinamibacterales bacterium]
MSRRVILETLTGHGALFLGTRRIFDQLPYAVEVSRTMFDDGDGNERPGLSRIDGSVNLGGQRVNASLVGEPIELQLEDGRRWQCFLRSDTGELSNRGGLIRSNVESA